MTFKVTATSLNLRSQPKVSPTNRIATLPNGQLVDKISEAAAPWWKVSTTLGGATLIGFTSSDFLVAQASAPPSPAATSLIPVHLEENRPSVTRDTTNARAFPLGEPGRPTRDGTTPPQRVTDLRNIITFLDVENKARYRPGAGKTFCNIYAYDYCYLAGAYLPRVWWTASAIAKLLSGQNVAVQYGATVVELNANSLHDWLQEFGPTFGWKRVASPDDLQAAANLGKVAVISGQRVELNTPGHICLVVPEDTPPRVAVRSRGVVTLQLQSQAGAQNFSYSPSTKWWAGVKFRSFSFWVHD